MAKETKMIRIVSRGFVTTSRGRVMSPILSPYKESINRIWNMLTVDRADIDEKLPDGSFIRLTVQNYDKDNSVSSDVASKVPVKTINEPTKKVETPVNKPAQEHTKNNNVAKPEEVNKVEKTPEVSNDTKKVNDTKEEVVEDESLDEVEVNDTTDNNSVNRNKKNKKRNKNHQSTPIVTVKPEDKPEDKKEEKTDANSIAVSAEEV